MTQIIRSYCYLLKFRHMYLWIQWKDLHIINYRYLIENNNLTDWILLDDVFECFVIKFHKGFFHTRVYWLRLTLGLNIFDCILYYDIQWVTFLQLTLLIVNHCCQLLFGEYIQWIWRCFNEVKERCQKYWIYNSDKNQEWLLLRHFIAVIKQIIG